VRFELNSEGRHACGRWWVLIPLIVISISLSLFVISPNDYAKLMLSCLFMTFLVTDQLLKGRD